MKRLKAVLAEVLEVDANTLDKNSSPNTVATWDSMRGLMLITKLEAEYSLSFTMDEVLSVKKVGDIAEILKMHGVEIIPD